jgi:ABC-type sugar transport system substrate-binding protein
MKRNPKAVIAALGAAALVTTLGACASASPDPGDTGAPAESFKLAGVAAYASDPYWISLMCGATKEAKAEGSEIRWYAANVIDAGPAQQNFQAAKLTKPDGMIIGAFDPQTFATQTADLMKAGTPVISVDGPMDPAAELFQVASSTDVDDFADLIASSIGDSGSLGVLGGIPDIEPAAIRWRPVVKAVAEKAPDIEILDTQYDGIDRNKAAQITSAMIIAHPDLVAIYAISGPEGEGAASAVKQAGKSGQIKVYAYDASPGEVEALKNGDIEALISQPAGNEGAESVRQLITYLKQGTSGPVEVGSPQNIDLPLMVLTKDNVDSAEAQPYLYKTECDA